MLMNGTRRIFSGSCFGPSAISRRRKRSTTWWRTQVRVFHAKIRQPPVLPWTINEPKAGDVEHISPRRPQKDLKTVRRVGHRDPARFQELLLETEMEELHGLAEVDDEEMIDYRDFNAKLLDFYTVRCEPNLIGLA
jgi:hypothetical protein